MLIDIIENNQAIQQVRMDFVPRVGEYLTFAKDGMYEQFIIKEVEYVYELSTRSHNAVLKVSRIL